MPLVLSGVAEWAPVRGAGGKETLTFYSKMNADPYALLLEIDAWNAATSDNRLASAHTVAETLPKAFTFDGLATHTLGDQSHEIAVFHYDDCAFALLPGQSNALLGYDRSNPYRPNDTQLDDWHTVQAEYGWTIDDYLNEYLGPLRRSTISPILIETVARRFEYAQNGDNQTDGYNRVQSQCGDGFRLPTPDEWEYACAAGSRTLFRWGNDCPVSNSYSDKEFTLHKHPNAFGITMNHSTYDSELCQGPTLRGGDGGGSVCGGIGNVITWFPLASSFQVSGDEMEGWWIDDVLARRVWSIVAPNTA